MMLAPIRRLPIEYGRRALPCLPPETPNDLEPRHVLNRELEDLAEVLSRSSFVRQRAASPAVVPQEIREGRSIELAAWDAANHRSQPSIGPRSNRPRMRRGVSMRVRSIP